MELGGEPLPFRGHVFPSEGEVAASGEVSRLGAALSLELDTPLCGVSDVPGADLDSSCLGALSLHSDNQGEASKSKVPSHGVCP